MVRRTVPTHPQAVVSKRLLTAFETMTDALDLIHQQAEQGQPVTVSLKRLTRWGRSAVREARGLERVLSVQPGR